MGDEDGVAADWRDERIAELEAEVVRKAAELAVRARGSRSWKGRAPGPRRRWRR